METKCKHPGLAIIIVGSLLTPLACFADPATTVVYGEPHVQQTPRQSPTSFLPFIAIPGRFLFTGGYYMNLNRTEMRIDHIASDSRCTQRNRTFMISASYAQPVGQLFSSRYELPLFSADRFAPSRLSPASFGDYVVHLSNEPLYSAALTLQIVTRF